MDAESAYERHHRRHAGGATITLEDLRVEHSALQNWMERNHDRATEAEMRDVLIQAQALAAMIMAAEADQDGAEEQAAGEADPDRYQDA